MLWSGLVASANGLIATNDSLYFIGSISEQRFQLLSRLDLLTGQQEWQTSKESRLPIVTTFNSSYIFTGTGSRGQITAYDLESGAVAWKKPLPLRARAIYYMSAIENELYVNGSGSAEFYILDIENGRIQERGHPRDIFPIFFAKGDVVYQGRFRKFLVASNKVTNDILWEIEFEEEIFQAPLFIEDTVLIRTDKSGFLGEIFAVDLVNGKTLWNSPKNVTSNVAAANGTAYYLTEDSYLMAVDMKTGQRIGEVLFSPSLTTLDPIDQVNKDFYVAVHDEIVVVYFGSGSQLFAFRFLLRGL